MLAESILLAIGAFASVGAVVAIAFLTRGISTVDPVAKGSPWAFRMIVFPGVAALWPLILWRWVAAARRTGAGA